MKVEKDLRETDGVQDERRNGKTGGNSARSFAVLTLCAVLAMVISLGTRTFAESEGGRVYAASDGGEGSSYEEVAVPTGIAGVVSGVTDTPLSGSTVTRIGSSCEQVIVGQRVQKVTNTAADLNVSSSMENKVNELDARSITLAENPTLMSDEDYDTLLRIVEAEAGSEDIKGRVLVANVIMNRVKSEDFPNTVTEVVWDNSDGVPQFSPTYDGRINEVAVSDETREAVKQALKGTDYSEGALFFIQKSAAEEHNVKWFEKDLKRLFKYGVHEFYTYK
ncbi:MULTISPECIES: cell wall hydrolase [Blautia]|uniref:Cell wall hydrolase n=1 Tax=Blautia obeum TaxID=40520 RepID=A0A367FVI8_9FIRM|nr:MULTISPECIES: cell wall hydrolase [Blautia]NSG61943.1 cell wall hydrolase [Blautia massiliensis (ex Durand et al. 2017)]NSK95809.1 cell wall hydrolase [Blautia massiliensis (ex Durand et al. 2017)]RCH41754.1 cell wall hydrolase [Blautia obeum]